MSETLTTKELSNAALAYYGDSVLELLVRERLVRGGLSTAAHLNAAARDYVTAPKQACAMERLMPHLTEEEAAIYRRGRNMGHGNVPKSASAAEYRRATGMEVLFGYLHLTGQTERLDYLFRLGYGLIPDAPDTNQSGE